MFYYLIFSLFSLHLDEDDGDWDDDDLPDKQGFPILHNGGTSISITTTVTALVSLLISIDIVRTLYLETVLGNN